MYFPVRCFSCGKVIGHLWDKYKDKVNKGKNMGEALDELGVERYCCRRMFLGHVDLYKEVVRFRRY